MAKRFVKRTKNVEVRIGKKLKRTSEKIFARPLQLKGRDLVRWQLIQPNPWWMTIHKRGPRRLKIGEDPLEARAYSKERVPGTLPERIMYRYLIERLFFSTADVDFQSSLSGGRLELGGIVADFIIQSLQMIVRVQGPTHGQFLVVRKDEEQRMALEEMGFRIVDIDDTTIYNEYALEEWARRTFNLASSVGGSGGALGTHEADREHIVDPADLNELHALFVHIDSRVDDLLRMLGSWRVA